MYQRPSVSETQELAGKGRIHNDGIILFVHQLPPPPSYSSQRAMGLHLDLLVELCASIYVPLFMRP